MCRWSGCARTCQSSTSMRVCASAGKPALTGAASGCSSCAGVAGAGPACCNSSSRSRGVSADTSACSGTATPEARSIRSSSSARDRLSSPRSCSSLLSSVTGGAALRMQLGDERLDHLQQPARQLGLRSMRHCTAGLVRTLIKSCPVGCALDQIGGNPASRALLGSPPARHLGGDDSNQRCSASSSRRRRPAS